MRAQAEQAAAAAPAAAPAAAGRPGRPPRAAGGGEGGEGGGGGGGGGGGEGGDDDDDDDDDDDSGGGDPPAPAAEGGTAGAGAGMGMGGAAAAAGGGSPKDPKGRRATNSQMLEHMLALGEMESKLNLKDSDEVGGGEGSPDKAAYRLKLEKLKEQEAHIREQVGWSGGGMESRWRAVGEPLESRSLGAARSRSTLAVPACYTLPLPDARVLHSNAH